MRRTLLRCMSPEVAPYGTVPERPIEARCWGKSGHRTLLPEVFLMTPKRTWDLLS
jgi:hypothetical protein